MNMRRNLIIGSFVGMMLFHFGTAAAQQTVRISGQVEFIDKDFKVSVFRRAGTDRKVLAETVVDSVTHRYSFDVPFDEVGSAVVDAGRWQSVNVWLENENLDIDFRGLDTAKVKIKNPPYVYIRGGKNNELMNLANFVFYRDYQQLISLSQSAYKANFADQDGKQQLTNSLYDINNDNSDAWLRYLIERYGDCNSVLYILDQLRDEKIEEAALKKLEAQSESSAKLVAKYRDDKEQARIRKARVAEGAVAPDFVSLTEKGKKVHPADFKGKVLVIDFWASWCGPCRKEIPSMKTIYADQDKKQVEFLSVSIDAKRDAWLKAVGEEKMPWKLTWTPDAGKEVMDLYQFSGIPFIIVIDKEGKIFRKHVRGEAVRKAIEDALKK